MSSIFNKNKNIKKSEILTERKYDNNSKYPQMQNENKMQPITISTNIVNKMQNNEIIDKNQKQNIKEQHTQARDSGKKPKKTMHNRQKSQNQELQNNNNNNEIENNKNEDFTQKIEKKLRDTSISKSKFTNKKVKKNDFLKSSINLNSELEFSSYTNSNNKNENNNTNNVFSPMTNINKEINDIINPSTNINLKKTSIFNFEEEKGNNNNEEKVIKEKESEKNIRISNIKNINQNLNNEDIIPKRATNKKLTYQSQKINMDQKQAENFILDKTNNIRSSSKENIFLDTKKNYTINNNIIIPLLNRAKENNCFLNVIIQTLFNLGEFRKELLRNNENLERNNKIIREFYNLFKSYEEEERKNINNKGQIEPIISVNILRNYLNELYRCYRPGETGDPMETLGYIFDIIHQIYCKKRRLDYKNIENCKCPVHQYFFLKLVDIISCPNCKAKKTQIFNKDCFMINILIRDITNKLHGKTFSTYNLKLFSKLRENNETFESENKTKIPECNCNKKIISSYEKKLKLTGPSSTYLIINITWAEEFPKMLEILTAFALIPISDNIENLFPFEDIKTKRNDIYYIKSIILYGIYHYVCIIYIKDQKKWAVIDDKTIKFINKYFELIDFLLRNHLMPVGIIYSKDYSDQISENEIKSNSLNKDEYKILYDFCRDVDLRRGLKVSDLVVSKNSFNENNENYLNNNYFYKSIFDYFPSFNDNVFIIKNNTPLENKKNEINLFNHKTSIKPNKKNINNIFNKDNSQAQNEIKGKNNILNGRKIMGDFNNNNLKGGILIFSNSIYNEADRNNEKSEQKEENDFLNFGKNYEGDD